MRPRPYLETAIPSYLTALPSRDLVVAAHQRITSEWWARRRQDFDLFVSQLVNRECARGDVEAAARRLAVLDGLPLLDEDDRVEDLATAFTLQRGIPERSVADSTHIALAVLHGMDDLLTCAPTWHTPSCAVPSTRSAGPPVSPHRSFVPR